MKNSIEHAVSEYQEYFDKQEPESAPSGEWAEYNVQYLADEAKLDGMEDIKFIVGTCDECKYAMSSGKGKDYRDCKEGNGIHVKNWYCGDFSREGKEEQ